MNQALAIPSPDAASSRQSAAGPHEYWFSTKPCLKPIATETPLEPAFLLGHRRSFRQCWKPRLRLPCFWQIIRSGRENMRALTMPLLVALTACGGGGTGQPANPTRAQAAAEAPSTPASGPDEGQEAPHCLSNVTVQVYGDSTQVAAFRWGYLQAALDAHYGAGVVTVFNQAASGTSTVELIQGHDGVNPAWPQNVTADIAMVNHGINDQAFQHPMDVYESNMHAIAHGPGHIVIETPNPIAHWRNVPDAPWAEAGRAAAAEAGIAVADVQAYVLSLPDWENLLTDGIHPSEQLAQMIVDNVTAPAIEQIADGLLYCKR